MTKSVYIVGSKGIPAKYGGFETFVEKLTEFQQDKDIQYYVACMRENSAKSDITADDFQTSQQNPKKNSLTVVATLFSLNTLNSPTSS